MDSDQIICGATCLLPGIVLDPWVDFISENPPGKGVVYYYLYTDLNGDGLHEFWLAQSGSESGSDPFIWQTYFPAAQGYYRIDWPSLDYPSLVPWGTREQITQSGKSLITYTGDGTASGDGSLQTITFDGSRFTIKNEDVAPDSPLQQKVLHIFHWDTDQNEESELIHSVEGIDIENVIRDMRKSESLPDYVTFVNHELRFGQVRPYSPLLSFEIVAAFLAACILVVTLSKYWRSTRTPQ